jgi:hypothetical protein
MMTGPNSKILQDFSASDNGQYKKSQVQFSSCNTCFSSLRQWFAKNTDHCYELWKICNPLFYKLRVLDIFKCIGFSFCVHTNIEFPTYQTKNPSYVKYLQKSWRESPGDAQQNRLTQDFWMPYLLPMQDKCFYLNLALKYVR